MSNSVTGAPVSRALVQLYVGGARTTLTDSEGRFHFENLEESNASISARKPGFFSDQELAARGGAMNFAQKPFHVGPDSPSVSLKLTPEGVIFGRISSDGEPVESLPVKLMSPQVRAGRKVWVQSGDASTDEDGNFRISNLLPGTYYVAAGPSSATSTLGVNAKSKGYSEAFFPGVSEMAAAAPVEIAAGQQTEADFSLKRERVYQLSGVVNGVAPATGINLQLINSLGDAGSFPYRFDPVSGGFVASATAGTYTLKAQAFENGNIRIAEIPLTVVADMAGIALALAPAKSIPVHVSTDFVTARAKQTALSGLPLTLHLASSEARLTSADYWATNQNNQLGLAVENVQPGKYLTEISTNGSFYVQSAHSGGIDLLRDDLPVSADAQPAPIEVTLRDDGASLKLSLQDPHASATAIIIPDRYPRLAESRQFYSGQLQLSGLAPGEYSVIAFDNVDRLEYTNPDILSPYMGSAAHLTLGPNQTSSVTLQVTAQEK